MIYRTILWLMLLLLPLLAQPPAPASELTTLEGLVKEWLDLEDMWSTEAVAQSEAAAEMARMKQLAIEERKQWEALAAEMEGMMQPQAKRAVALASREAAQAEAWAKLEPALQAASTNLTEAFRAVPPPMRAQLQEKRDRLAATREATPVHRLQAILVARQALGQLNQRIHALQWEHDGVLYDVVMAGLGAGWAVSPDGKQAASIRWQDQAWVWQRNDAMAENVRAAWDAASGIGASRPTTLPVQVVK